MRSIEPDEPPRIFNDLPDTETIMKTLITSIFGALVLSCGAASMAANSSDQPQIAVKFGDLNPSNPESAAVLYRRLVAAAYEVCKPYDIDRNILSSQAPLRACVQKALAGAVNAVGRPELTAIYSATNPRPLPITAAALTR